MSLLLLVPDALRGQANSGRASRSASFSDPASRYPAARMPNADSAESSALPDHVSKAKQEADDANNEATTNATV